MMNARFAPHNSIDSRKWSVAVYERLSDEDSDKRCKNDASRSIVNQNKMIFSYIEKMNAEPLDGCELAVYDTYSDDDYTGMNFNRPGFQRMLGDIESDLVDCIVVKNLSRLGRNDSEMQNYLEVEFEKKGKQVRVIAIGDHYDSLYTEVTLGYKILIMMNREYSEQQHRNVITAMRCMQKNGQFVGAFAPYGYRKDPENKHRFLIDEYAAGVVRQIYRLYLDGVSPKEIAARLTLEGIVNPSAYKRLNGSKFSCCNKISDSEVHWTSSTVKHILSDETYTGTLVQHKQVQKRLIDPAPAAVPRKDWIRCENAHEAIVSKEYWDTAQSMMKTVKRDTTKEDEVTIFKGLLKCGDCGHAMRKKWDTYSHVRDGKTARYLYYNCSTYRDFSQNRKLWGENAPACTSHYISDRLLRDIIIDDVNKIIGQISDLKKMAEEDSRPADIEKKTLQRRLCRAEDQLRTYRKMLRTARMRWYKEEIDDAEFREDEAEFKKVIGQCGKETAALRNSLEALETAAAVDPWVRQLAEKGKITELDRATVVELIEEIRVFQDKHIEIVYKFDNMFDSSFIKSA